MTARVTPLLAILALAPLAPAQETFVPGRPAPLPVIATPRTPSQPDPATPGMRPQGANPREPDPAEPLYGYSLLVVKAPKPRSYKTHDLLTIVVDESSKQAADQTLNTNKKVNNTANLNAVLDPMEVLQLRLRGGDTKNLKLLDVNANNKFDSQGKFERNDKLSLKIQAEIIDVKPNGVLTLEARKTIDKNGETTTTVLSGVCRPEDITANNTVFSSQLANLTLVTRSEGQVNDAAKKGIITRVLETLFAF
jgi:flagellar L-ring protein precursor FlgH